jgi:predicted DNA-binding transcriptional regulator AlpA
MAATYLRYRHLVSRGVVNSRQELKRLQDKHGFPPGRLLGPNTRVWTDEEIDAYIAARPVRMPLHQLRGAAKLKHERKQAQMSETNEV